MAGIAHARSTSWPDFRGPDRDGRYQDPILREWPARGLTKLWSRSVGGGYASVVAVDGRVFTIEQRDDREVLSALDLESGRELWTASWVSSFVSENGDGPRATPTYHDGRVYALGARGELRCVNAATGELGWSRNILTDATARNVLYGMAGAPLVVDGKVIVLPGGGDGQSVAAYDGRSGVRRWTALNDRQSYTSPMAVVLGGMRQILVVSATRAVGLTLEDGRLLWEYPWGNGDEVSVAQPLLLGDDRVFLSASYGSGAAVFQVKRVGNAFDVSTKWRNQRMKNKFTSSVLHDDFIYGLDEGILACVDATTGELMWKGGRYGYGQLMIAGDRLIVTTERGELVQVRATPEGHQELARFAVFDDRIWNHPAIVDGRLIVRNHSEMAAFNVRPR